MKRKMLWSVVGYTAVIGASLLTRHSAREAYRKTTGTAPPENPGRRDTQWREALVWGMASGALVGVARVVGQRLGDEARRRRERRRPLEHLRD
ncbi:DUF4235 domain-containing protein [Halomonas nitroreducens]|uniref:DUF4235 domain-containing protein n=1 Tax=Halomonas nitroreducens TaxID=447425 RepID=A0A3S0J778_9GAMM|nr:DUF4235 domain-containing protein [Halomonas nitroreducens]RTQ99123.1 DUF4235 domain-containing protein [Halomonas nitroreducens]